MSLDFNKGLFDVFGSGDAFQSITLERSNGTSLQASALHTRLEKHLPPEHQPEPLNPLQPDERKVKNCMSALSDYSQGMKVFNAHTQSRLDSFLQDMEVASAVKQIDSYVTNTGPSCSNINTIAGTLTGAADNLLDASNQLLDQLAQGISDFEQGILKKAPFEDLLEYVAEALTGHLSSILGMISNEAKMLERLYRQHQQLSKTFSVQALINDPCVRPLIARLAGPKLSKVLVDDFGVEDIF